MVHSYICPNQTNMVPNLWPLLFAAHSWLKDPVHSSGEQLKQLNLNFGQSEAITSCLSNPQLAMNEDYYCSDVSPAVIDTNLSLEISPVFTCKSSFSSFLVDQRTPCSISGGFSFSSSYEPNIPDFSSPIPSMPSFTFFSPCSTVQQSNKSLAREGKLPTSDKGILPPQINSLCFFTGECFKKSFKIRLCFIASIRELVCFCLFGLIEKIRLEY